MNEVTTINLKLGALVAAVVAAVAVSHVSSVAYAGEPGGGNTLAAQDPVARYKAVFHVADNDSKKWNQALSNAQNVQEALGKENAEIEIVTNGGGIEMLMLESEVGSRVQEALKSGIKFLACENTMKRLKLRKDDMLPNIGYTPSGVIEIMQRQQEGWSYVRN